MATQAMMNKTLDIDIALLPFQVPRIIVPIIAILGLLQPLGENRVAIRCFLFEIAFFTLA